MGRPPLPLPPPPRPPRHAWQSSIVYGAVQVFDSKQPMQPVSVFWSLQLSAPDPEPEPEPDPDPLPPLEPQSAGHVAPFSPACVSHTALPHDATLPPLLPLLPLLPPVPQSAVHTPTSVDAQTPSPHSATVPSSPLSAHANARAIARAQKIPDLILIMVADG